MRPVSFCIALIIAAFWSHASAADIRTEVQGLFEHDMTAVDFARVMVEVEQIINPEIDGDSMLAEIDRMASHIQTAVPDTAPEWDKIGAIRQYIYEPGYWNDNRAFAYDHDDPYGLIFENRLLSDYLADRRGNCVTMPFLFIAIGQRLGLDVRPSLAPQHVLVRFTTQDGSEHNIEATNGGLIGDNSPYTNNMPIIPQAIENRVYLATLTNEEAVAVLAVLVVDYLIKEQRYHDAMAVADTLLEHYPTFAYVMVKKATAAYYLLQAEFYDQYATAEDVPPEQRQYLAHLQRVNQSMFDEAEGLGWRPFER